MVLSRKLASFAVALFLGFCASLAGADVVNDLISSVLPGSDISNLAAGTVLPNQYIVRYKPEVTNARATTLELLGGLLPRVLYSSAAFKGFAGALTPAQVAAAQQDPRVEKVDEDRVVRIFRPNPQYELGPNASEARWTAGSGRRLLQGPAVGAICTPGANPTNLRRVRKPATYRPPASPNGGLGLAIVDTGCLCHKDLNVVGGAGCDTGTCIDGEYVDGNGHGTHVAGTAAGQVTGVAPRHPTFCVKVLNALGIGTLNGIIAGLVWVADHADQIGVINMSLGGAGSAVGCDAPPGQISSYEMVTCMLARSKGVSVIVAAGNEGAEVSTPNGPNPANFKDAVLAVSALTDSDGNPPAAGATGGVDTEDGIAGFSNFGPLVKIAAPGVNVCSTFNLGIISVCPSNPLNLIGIYDSLSGTSMASPHVAGAAARLRTLGVPGGVSMYPRLINSGSCTMFDRADGFKEKVLDVTAAEAGTVTPAC